MPDASELSAKTSKHFGPRISDYLPGASMLDPVLVTVLSQGVGLLAILAIGYGAIERWSISASSRAVCLGLWFGLGAVLAMTAPVRVGEVFLLDVRCIVIGLAAAFGAPMTIVISTAIAIAFRIYLGGAGAIPGAVAILLAAMLGFFGIMILRNIVKTIWLRYAILGFLISLNIASGFLLPFDQAIFVIKAMYPVIAPTSIISAALLGSFMEREWRMMLLEEIWRNAALTDQLTGPPNRRWFERVADTYLAGASSTAECCLLIIDIDHFKQINDLHGHAIGDNVLKKVAETIRRSLRQSDHAARIGGEEFAILLAQTRKRDGIEVAERIRSNIANVKEWGFQTEGVVQISVGISAAKTSATYEAIFLTADKALYDAKASGRNRVVYRELIAPDSSPRDIASAVCSRTEGEAVHH